MSNLQMARATRNRSRGGPEEAHGGGLEARDLTITNDSGEQLVSGVDLDLRPGSSTALVGESGSGKTLMAKALLGLSPRGVKVKGRLRFGERSIPADAPAASWQELRGRAVTLLPQDPFTSLSAGHRIGNQIMLSMAGLSRSERHARARGLLEEVELPQRVFGQFPHELSGGMRQRAAIAATLASDPAVLIADEPTTALDAATRLTVLDLIDRLRQDRSLALLLISHDLGLVRRYCEQVHVLRFGKVVESGSTTEVFREQRDPYTRQLIESALTLSVAEPDTSERVEERSRSESSRDVDTEASRSTPLLRVSGAEKRFGDRPVITNIGFELLEGQRLGIVGTSGSGKSTLARCILGLEELDAGEIEIDGTAVRPGDHDPTRIQIVFQDPYTALNPAHRIGRTLRDALRVRHPRAGAEEVRAALERVELGPELADRFPRELSGGQRQRVAIARALATEPRLLLCDESVSALDATVQSQILALLTRMSAELELTLLFISHDLAVIEHITDRLIVMDQGRIVESGRTASILRAPAREYTRSLVSAARH